MKSRSLGTVVLIATVSMLAIACSGEFSFSFGGESADDAAVTLIEGQEMQDQLGIGEISNAQCGTPPVEEVGAVFSCTADSPQGQLEYEVEIDREDHIFAQPTNVISPEAIKRLAEKVVESMNDDLEVGFSSSALDCGDRVVVFDPSGDSPVLACELTSPGGAVYDTDITITDVDSGDFEVDYEVGFEAVIATAVIQGEQMQALLNIGPLANTQCEEPTSKQVGTFFECTADSSQGEIVYEVEIDRPLHVFASPINVIAQDTQATLAAQAAAALNEQVGSNLPDDAIDCGDSAVVIAAAGDTVLGCALTSPDDGAVYDAEITITDVETGAFSVNVADLPRT